METNNSKPTSFVDSFKSVSKNLETRYSINMHLDFIQEFVKFADNTRDIDLQDSILRTIVDCENLIIEIINDYERTNKENTNSNSN